MNRQQIDVCWRARDSSDRTIVEPLIRRLLKDKRSGLRRREEEVDTRRRDGASRKGGDIRRRVKVRGDVPLSRYNCLDNNHHSRWDEEFSTNKLEERLVVVQWSLMDLLYRTRQGLFLNCFASVGLKSRNDSIMTAGFDDEADEMTR